MSDDRQTPKPRRPPCREPRDPRRPPVPKPRDPAFFRDAGARFAELTDRLIEVLNSSGGFGAEGDNAPDRSVLRAAANNFAAASGMSEITRSGIERGQLTEEDLDRGLGFAVFGHDGSTLVSPGGWIGGHRSYLLLDPERGVAVVAMTNADDLSPAFFGRRAYEMVGPALAAPVADAGAIPAPADPSWQRYLGLYSDPWGWQYEVLVLDGELVMFEHEYPPADDPQEDVTRLTPAGERAFRLPDGDPVVFELGPDDRVVRRQRRYDYLYPVDAEGNLLVPPGTPPPVRVEVRP